MLVKAADEHKGPFCDILYGVPISLSKLTIIEELRHCSGCRIHVIIDHIAQVAFINDFISSLAGSTPLSAFVKLDTGYHRAGITCDDRGVHLVKAILESPHILLHGLYSHW